MAEDHVGGTGILQHFGGNITCEGTAWFDMAILAAKHDWRALANFLRRHEQNRWRAHKHFRLSSTASRDTRANGFDFGEPLAQAVHLPVSGKERARSLRHGELSVGFQVQLLSISHTLR